MLLIVRLTSLLTDGLPAKWCVSTSAIELSSLDEFILISTYLPLSKPSFMFILLLTTAVTIELALLFAVKPLPSEVTFCLKPVVPLVISRSK